MLLRREGDETIDLTKISLKEMQRVRGSEISCIFSPFEKPALSAPVASFTVDSPSTSMNILLICFSRASLAFPVIFGAIAFFLSFS